MPYGLFASKIDTSNIFDGCLSLIRNEITDKIPEGKKWVNEELGIRALIGTKEEINQHTVPYVNKSPTWYEIYTGSKWILPSAYSLMGRRAHNNSHLKGWNFSGLNKDNAWILLHNESNKRFYRYENRTYILKGNEAYRAFRIEMTEPDSVNEWALCIGQIEVFGNIYRSHFIPKNGIFKCTTMNRYFFNYLITAINLILC